MRCILRSLEIGGVVLALALVAGCNRNENNGTASGISGTGVEVTGDPRVSTGDGGQGSGSTGTEGSEPANNPGVDAESSK